MAVSAQKTIAEGVTAKLTYARQQAASSGYYPTSSSHSSDLELLQAGVEIGF